MCDIFQIVICRVCICIVLAVPDIYYSLKPPDLSSPAPYSHRHFPFPLSVSCLLKVLSIVPAMFCPDATFQLNTVPSHHRYVTPPNPPPTVTTNVKTLLFDFLNTQKNYIIYFNKIKLSFTSLITYFTFYVLYTYVLYIRIHTNCLATLKVLTVRNGKPY